MFKRALIVGLLAAGGLGLVTPSAGAATPSTAPTNQRGVVAAASTLPANARQLAPGATRTGTALLAGKQVTYTATRSKAVRITPAQVAAITGTAPAVTPATTYCWSTWGNITWGPSWARLMIFQQDIAWCGDGSTISSHGVRYTAKVYAAGQVTFWTWKGMNAPASETMYYNNWAWQLFGQGQFAQCPVIQFACLNYHYPWLAFNIYANGHADFFYNFG